MSQHHAFSLQHFIASISDLLDRAPNEATIIHDGGELLRRLVATDDWLPAASAQPDLQHYRQYLLHLDPRQRFSVISFVWGPGQHTPIHDHTVWGLIGMLRGAEYAQRYVIAPDGLPQRDGEPAKLVAGAVDAVSPTIGDLHQVSNAWADRVSISIHVYGGNIGEIERSAYDENGERHRFVSGYSGGLQTGDPAAV
jgi:predicted metal-dependent enzyme (double-stranded beta helix superfamily)